MKISFPVEDTIRKRKSVRNYQANLSYEQLNEIESKLNTFSNPFNIPVKLQLVNSDSHPNGEKLGTYGMIKGTDYFIAATVEDQHLALEALGYSVESLVLYLTSLDIGTCWIGGTFQRGKFADAISLNDGHLFPIIIPIGQASPKRHLLERVSRATLSASKRKDWNVLFFNNDLDHSLTKEQAKEYASPLEMFRLAPSAVNKQPWIVIMTDNTLHFYTKMAKHDSKQLDLTNVDIGAASCHFQLTLNESMIEGSFKVLDIFPEFGRLKYHYSWN